jgi:hypothetical protein
VHLSARRLVDDHDAGRGRRWGQTSTYRFAAVHLNAWVKVDVDVRLRVAVKHNVAGQTVEILQVEVTGPSLPRPTRTYSGRPSENVPIKGLERVRYVELDVDVVTRP